MHALNRILIGNFSKSYMNPHAVVIYIYLASIHLYSPQLLLAFSSSIITMALFYLFFSLANVFKFYFLIYFTYIGLVFYNRSSIHCLILFFLFLFDLQSFLELLLAYFLVLYINIFLFSRLIYFSSFHISYML